MLVGPLTSPPGDGTAAPGQVGPGMKARGPTAGRGLGTVPAGARCGVGRRGPAGVLRRGGS
jgi:hypothetical protein